MTEQTTGDSNATAGSANKQSAWFCAWLREGAEKLNQTLSPPEGAAKHFREARLEVLRGLRDLIDHRIQYLSKDKTRGSRIVVD